MHAEDGIQSRSETPRFLGPTRFSGGTPGQVTTLLAATVASEFIALIASEWSG